ncbi:MAG: multiheme c-type cytochrome [Bradymonadaceae bacterium]
MSDESKLATVGFVVTIALTGGLIFWFGGGADQEEQLEPEEILARAAAFYESRPYYERPHPHTEVPEGLPDLRSETCGTCHVEIYEEWSFSTHRRAWLDDAQFMEELAKSRGDHAEPGEEKVDVSWLCVNCHTPLVNQLEKLVVGLEDGLVGRPIYMDNPSFDPVLQEDAIGCATCHVQDGIVYGPFGDTDAPHPTARGDHLLDEANCVRCHQAEAHYIPENMACFFTTGEEWSQSSFKEAEETCQDCHMPPVTRKLAEAFDRPERETRRHWFGGSLIPKHPDFEDEIAPLREIFGSGADVELFLDEEAPCPDDEACRTYVVRVKNAHAGHNFPTGDPERHVDVHLRAFDESGEEVAYEKLRIGSVYEWWPEIKLLFDNRIPAGEYLDFTMILDAEGPARTFEVVAEKFRMFEEAFEHHELEGRYVRGRTFFEARYELEEDGKPRLIEGRSDRGALIERSP